LRCIYNDSIEYVSIVLQTLIINKFHVKSVLKLSAKCAKLLDILKKVRSIVFRRVTYFGISPTTGHSCSINAHLATGRSCV